MILVIRISGQVGLSKEDKETLFRMRIRKKYAAILLNHSEKNEKVLKKMRNHIAFGDIDKETLKELLQKRAKPVDKKNKIEVEKVVEQLDKKSLQSLGIKPFFSLHPPRGGIESKKHFGVGKGVLGHNKKMNELVRRML